MVKKIKDFTVIKLSLVLALLTVQTVLTAPEAHALVEVPTLRFGLGMMPLKFTAGTVAPEPTSLGNALTINPMFLWDVPSVRSRIGFHFLADLGSQYGFISTAGIGATIIFYPTGLSSIRELKENDSSIIKTKVSPYLQVSVTPTRFSVTIKDDSQISSMWQYFSVLAIETSVGAGVDYPFSENLIGFAGLHYRFAAITSEETNAGPLKYNGMGILVGIMTNFF